MENDIEKLKERLGRIHVPDARDKQFPMRSILPRKTPDRHYKYWWSNGWWGDQGITPQCVSYAWVHWLEDGGITQKSVPPPILNPIAVYNEAQKVDEWAGENYDGTSVRAGAKICQREGFISQYRWTWDVDTLAQAILTTAPVVVGTAWYYDMFFPDDKNIITATGQDMGGHAYVVNGVNLKTRMFRIKNSWGRSWGNKGFAYISFDDMQKLLDYYGEACLAVEIEKL